MPEEKGWISVETKMVGDMKQKNHKEEFVAKEKKVFN